MPVTRQSMRSCSNNLWVYSPEDYKGKEGPPWPLVVSLHGRSEGIAGGSFAELEGFGLPCLAMQGAGYPFLLAAPQLKNRQAYFVNFLDTLLDELEASYAVDSERIYLTGFDSGAMATWDYAMRRAERLAAIVPIAGATTEALANPLGQEPEAVLRIGHLPVWAFHGAKDEVAPLAVSQALVEVLVAMDFHPRFTVYPDLGHDIWREAYGESGLVQWLLSKRRIK